MKHSKEVTAILLVLFLLAQLIGLFVISQYTSDGIKELPFDIERPSQADGYSYWNLLGGVFLATLLALILIRYQARVLWKIWFFLSVWFTLLIAFGSVLREGISFILSFGFAVLKIFKNNVYIHNFTELFIYGGLAAIFVPILNLWIVAGLLILISIYDYIAVRKTKHMIKLAKFQTRMKVFAGLFVPYSKNKSAILGGGDIGFPLLFTGVVFSDYGWNALFVTFGVLLALGYLLTRGEKNKYYPAMPYLTVGCFLGFGLMLLFR